MLKAEYCRGEPHGRLKGGIAELVRHGDVLGASLTMQ